jgi:hypothetical protein
MRDGIQQEVLFTADDLGRDEETNLAIEQAHREGVLNAASLMLGQPGTRHALEVARRNPGLQIGWHFHACDSQPLTCAQWPWGRSPARAGWALAVGPAARALLRRELAAQWEAFLASGLDCRFINGHHHLHIHPFIAREMFARVSGAFSGWVRAFEPRFFGAQPEGPWRYRLVRRGAAHWLRRWPAGRRTQSLWGLDRLFRMDAGEVARVLPTLGAGRHEFLFHPRKRNDADQKALVELRGRLGA